MKKLLIMLLTGVLSFACGSNATGNKNTKEAPPKPLKPATYTYRVINTFPHSRNAYTQGLQFIDGELWEGTGQTGESRLQRVDLETGKEHIVGMLPRSEFGEGITLLGERIYQLTWMDNKCYVYDRKTHKRIHTYRYYGEGWGLTTDGKMLYMSDGSEKIYTINPETFRKEAQISVTTEGRPTPYINELEWIEGRIWANVYLSNQILIIDPKTGVTEGVIDLEGLLPQKDYTSNTDVLNGIAYDQATKRIFVTGKNWPKLFEIEIIKL